MQCKKCGAELHEDQKVCIKCGERTAAGFNFDTGEKEKKDFRNLLIDKRVLYAAGGVFLIILIAIIINAMKITPPNVVCSEWFVCMHEQRLNGAKKLMTEELISDKSNDMSLQTDAIEFNQMIDENGCKYKISKPNIDGKTATFLISIDRNGEKMVTLSKVGRRWLVSDIK